MEISNHLLSKAEVQSIHWDERNQSVTVAFESSLTAESRGIWEASPGHTHVRFYLLFDQIEKLEIKNWSYQNPIYLTFSAKDTKTAVTIVGKMTEISFMSITPRLTEHRSFTMSTL